MKENILFVSEIAEVKVSVVFIAGDIQMLREDLYILFGAENNLTDKIYNLNEVIEIGNQINKELTEEFYIWAKSIINSQGMNFEDILNKLL